APGPVAGGSARGPGRPLGAVRPPRIGRPKGLQDPTLTPPAAAPPDGPEPVGLSCFSSFRAFVIIDASRTMRPLWAALPVPHPSRGTGPGDWVVPSGARTLSRKHERTKTRNGRRPGSARSPGLSSAPGARGPPASLLKLDRPAPACRRG